MAAFAVVVTATSTPLPADRSVPTTAHQAATDAMLRAAADRTTHTGGWRDDSIAIDFVYHDCFEDVPVAMVTPTGRAWLEGRVAQSAVDVERVLAAVIDGDVRRCTELRGSFSIWSWHAPTCTLRVVTDPFARRPVYWTQPPSAVAQPRATVVAATEIRQVLAHPSVRPVLDEAVMVANMGDLVMPVSVTPFVDVRFLPPGSMLVATPGRTPRIEPWMTWPDEVDFGPTRHEWADRIREVTVEAVRRSIPDDGLVGITVSGGLDSSMLAGMAIRTVGPDRLRALTMRFPGHPSDETRYQDLMLDATGMAEISVGPQGGVDYWAAICGEVARRALPMVWLQPEIDALMQSAAAAGIRTVIRGVGGDELFAPGSATVVDALVSRRFAAIGQFLGDPPMRNRATWALRGLRAAGGQAATARHRALAHIGGLPDWLTPSPAILEALTDLVATPPRGLGLSAAMRRDRWRRLATDAARAQSDWADASATAALVAVVDPLLDVDVVTTATSVPESLRWAPGDPRRLQRGVALPYLPEQVMRRPDKAYMGPATFTHLRTPHVASRLDNLELAERGLVDPLRLGDLFGATSAAHDRGDAQLAGGPISLALVLSTEALLRSVT